MTSRSTSAALGVPLRARAAYPQPDPGAVHSHAAGVNRHRRADSARALGYPHQPQRSPRPCRTCSRTPSTTPNNATPPHLHPLSCRCNYPTLADVSSPPRFRTTFAAWQSRNRPDVLCYSVMQPAFAAWPFGPCARFASRIASVPGAHGACPAWPPGPMTIRSCAPVQLPGGSHPRPFGCPR